VKNFLFPDGLTGSIISIFIGVKYNPKKIEALPQHNPYPQQQPCDVRRLYDAACHKGMNEGFSNLNVTQKKYRKIS